jgi:arylformamidase
MRAVWLGLLLVLCALPVQAQSVERDVAYGADSAQRLDLYLPKGTGFATVVFVHGGSLTSGDKTDQDYGQVCRPFSTAGIACATINYRLAPRHVWPAQAEDVASAFAWVRRNVASRGGDSTKLILFGHSSGATLVALIGADSHYLHAQGISSDDVSGVIPMGSIMWDDDLSSAIQKHGREKVAAAFARDPDNRMFADMDAYIAHWPIAHLRRGLPPYLFLIAETEQLQPPVLRTNKSFADSARALRNDAAVHVLKGRTHYSAIRRLHEPGDSTYSVIFDFVRRVTRTPAR